LEGLKKMKERQTPKGIGPTHNRQIQFKEKLNSCQGKYRDWGKTNCWQPLSFERLPPVGRPFGKVVVSAAGENRD
jgi:hypothetical protein